MKAVRGTAGPLRIGPDDLIYQPQFLANSEADALLQLLRRDLPWRQEVIVMFGRQVRQPRLTCWHGDAGAHCRYSGLQMQLQPWNPPLSRLQPDIQAGQGHALIQISRLHSWLLDY